MEETKYPRRHLYLCPQSLSNLNKLSKKYNRTESKVVRDLLNKRSSLKTLKFIEREIKTNKKALLINSRLPSNLNQIAHQLNEGTFVFNEYKFYELVEDLKDEIKELSLELKYNTRLLEEIL
ncbi:MAG: plasmid mobilization relaxosome protein MobC [Arcobacteraceae bacterium]